MNRVELVVFDIGRVLIRLCDDWQHAARVAGVSMPVLRADLDPGSREQLARSIEKYDTGKIDLATFAAEVSALRGIDAAAVEKLQQCYLIEAYPGVEELMDELDRLRIPMACLSNTAEPHWGLVHEKGGRHELPMHRLKHKFASHLLGLRKPDDAIYAHVERETGVQPQHIVFFDDMEENIAAARKRGWNAHQVAVGPNPIPQIRAVLRENGVAVGA